MRLKGSREPIGTTVTDTPPERRSNTDSDDRQTHPRPSASQVREWTFPDLQTLTGGLNSVFQELNSDELVTVLARRPNRRPGRRSPSEIVTVHLKDDRRLRLFCKYGGHDWHSHGLWGVAYEAEVYRQVLSSVDDPAPKFFGAYTASDPEGTWLILEYVEDHQQLKDAPQPEAMVETARWLARFHASTSDLLSEAEVPFLKAHDAAYYRAWAERTMEFAARRRGRFTWLAPLCEKWEELAAILLLPPTSIIHGDFYGSNILIHGGGLSVVDWESAALAAGVIDLAFHTEGWPEEIVELCEEEYKKTRWPFGPPSEFPRRLQAARLYQQLRWLGDHAEWTSAEGLKRLGDIAAELGLL